MTETPLLRHGGYGAARETTTVFCDGCGWSLVVAVSEVHPGPRSPDPVDVSVGSFL
ncbi:MAG TPA: hypothetical protein VGB14_06145 [Acidimicrobiales bacterium]